MLKTHTFSYVVLLIYIMILLLFSPPSVCFLQWSTALIPEYRPTQSGRAKLSTETLLLGPWCPMTAIPAITSSGHRFWPASRWVTGTSHYQNAWVRPLPSLYFSLCGLFIIHNLWTLAVCEATENVTGSPTCSQVQRGVQRCCLCKSLQSFESSQWTVVNF